MNDYNPNSTQDWKVKEVHYLRDQSEINESIQYHQHRISLYSYKSQSALFQEN